MDGLTIGELARQAGVNVETLRYYERRGLLPRPPRSTSGYRLYPQDTMRRVRFIKHAKGLGFSLKETSELLMLRVHPDTTCGDVRRRAEDKIADIDAKIHILERMKTTLTQVVSVCHGRGPISECPILAALDHVEEESMTARR